MSADLIKLRAQLEEAEEALHKLATGQTPVSVTFNGRSITDRGQSVKEAEQALLRHISRLETEIRNTESGRPRRGPIYLRA